MRSHTTVAWLLVLVAASAAAVLPAQEHCPRAVLPAYAHNDYENPRPLFQALELRFSGAEADVFLVNGVLRVGHSRRQAQRGQTLEHLYLTPLDSIIAKCGHLGRDRHPFLLTIEIKDASSGIIDSVVALLGRYPRLTQRDNARPPVALVLVGPYAQLDRPEGVPMEVQLRSVDQSVEDVSRGVRTLISLDYGKTVGRFVVTARGRERWLAKLRAVRAANPSALIRAYNVPAEAAVYQALLSAGVDLIGSKQLHITHRLLSGCRSRASTTGRCPRGRGNP